MYEYAVIRTEVGVPAKFVKGTTTGGKAEINAAKKLSDELSKSRFSVVAFGSYLHEITEPEDREKMMLACLYYILEMSQYDSPVGFMAQRIMDALNHYEYLENA